MGLKSSIIKKLTILICILTILSCSKQNEHNKKNIYKRLNSIYIDDSDQFKLKRIRASPDISFNIDSIDNNIVIEVHNNDSQVIFIPLNDWNVLKEIENGMIFKSIKGMNNQIYFSDYIDENLFEYCSISNVKSDYKLELIKIKPNSNVRLKLNLDENKILKKYLHIYLSIFSEEMVKYLKDNIKESKVYHKVTIINKSEYTLVDTFKDKSAIKKFDIVKINKVYSEAYHHYIIGKDSIIKIIKH